jgi:NAD(P)-dependent dehydrogenase (short-subunit alcohol dehydrogenase family)
MQRIPLNRFVEPAEIVAAMIMLRSHHGRYITGQIIHINGGLFMSN